jgi:hypothetical protein
LQELKKVIASFPFPSDDDLSSEYKQPSDVEEQSSGLFYSDLELDISQTIARNKPKRVTLKTKSIPENFIKGRIETYRNEMMGGFVDRVILNSENADLFVSKDAVIKRPTDVTGNIGSIAGDHVISFSFFLKYIESLVRGQEIYKALTKLRDWVASISKKENEEDPYKSIIDEATQHIQNTSEDFLCKHQAFAFLRDKFIPYITAVWNQKIGTAFRSTKTSAERSQEGNILKKALKNIFDINSNYTKDSISNFLNTVDYKPIEENYSLLSNNNIQNLLEKGYRTNYFKDLTNILSDIIETFFFMYEHDIEFQQRQNVVEELISSFLDLKGWLNYYKTNPQYLGENCSLEKLNLESLTELALSHIKLKKPILFDDLNSFSGSFFHSESDGIDSITSRDGQQIKLLHGDSIDEDYSAYQVEVTKTISRKVAEEHGDIGPSRIQGLNLMDNEGLGNCFYEAVADQLQLHNHFFIKRVPDGTDMHNILRLEIQGENFQDRQWAEDITIDRFVIRFPDVILAIIDTRNPSAGFISYYMDTDGSVTTNVDNTNLPEDRVIIRIAATGNHFMSVRSHLALENGTIRYEWNSELHSLGEIPKTEIEEYKAYADALISFGNQSSTMEPARESNGSELINNTNHSLIYNNDDVVENQEIPLDLSGLISNKNSDQL